MRSEKELDFLEKHIAELAESAVQKAYWDALSCGESVLEAVGVTGGSKTSQKREFKTSHLDDQTHLS